MGQEDDVVREVARTTGKAIDAGRELGGFVARFVDGPLEQASGIVEDKLRYLRWERQVRLMMRAGEFLAQQGLRDPTRPVPLKVALPIFEAASMEEDDDLQDMWARLLVNAADADGGADVTRGLVTVLRDFGRLEARLLQVIHDAPQDKYPNGVIPTALLPDKYLELEGETGLPQEPVQVALWHLMRLGCVDSGGTWASITGIEHITITPLGRALVRACTLKGSG